jgi:hypothetical protein
MSTTLTNESAATADVPSVPDVMQNTPYRDDIAELERPIGDDPFVQSTHFQPKRKFWWTKDGRRRRRTWVALGFVLVLAILIL